MGWLSTKFFSTFLLPPLNLLLLGIAALFLLKLRPCLGKLLLGLTLALLYLLSTPYFAARALKFIEPAAMQEPSPQDKAQAIVVLREPLIKSSVERVSGAMRMIARRATKVPSRSLSTRSATTQAPDFAETRTGRLPRHGQRS